jgi:WD40 repeat protein
MSKLNIKKDNDATLRLIAWIVLGGAAVLMVLALSVGLVVWWVMRPKADNSPAPVVTGRPSMQPPPNIFNPAAPQPAGPIAEVGPNGPFQPLPPAPPLEAKVVPPQRPSHKRVEFSAVRSFQTHVGPVFGLALSPDEHRAISGGADKTVRLWDLETGTELAKLEGHSEAVRDVAFAPDGKRVASAGQDGTLRLWDLTEKKTLRTLKGHDGAVRCVAFTPDGKRLLSGGADRSLRVWDVQTGERIRASYGHDSEVIGVAVSADGAFALTTGADHGATYWDLKSGRELAYLGIDRYVHVALFMPDGKRAVLAGDGATRVCDLSSGEQWIGFFREGELSHAAALLPDNTVLLQGIGNRLECRLLPTEHLTTGDAANPRSTHLGGIEAHSGPITRVRTTRDGKLALTAGEDGAVKLWRIAE